MTGLVPASFSRAKGRHRAPSKLATTMNSTARVSAAVAVSGGIAAAVAIPQVASASPSAAKVTTASNTHAESAAFVNLGLSSNSAQVSATVADTAAQQSTLLDLSKLVAAAPAAKPLLESVTAKTYTQPAPAAQPQQQTTTSSTSRSATRSTASATASNNSGSGNSGSSNSGSSNSGSGDSGSTGGSSVTLPSGSGNSAVIAIAERYLGVPYILGGSSPSGFDCSGLTSYVYRQLGISLPRTAAAQQAAVPSVSTPQVGDLVFFGYPAYHVGIYAGNGMMIAAPHPGTVVKLQPIYQTPSGYGRP